MIKVEYLKQTGICEKGAIVDVSEDRTAHKLAKMGIVRIISRDIVLAPQSVRQTGGTSKP